jgi:hypothetical protein
MLLNARLKVAVAALLAVAATMAVLSAVCYGIGRRIEPELRFLDPRRPPTLNEAVIASAIESALEDSNERNDVIFLGDSTCAFDIDPRRVEVLTGLRSYNLGSMGAIGPTGYLITLKAYLAHHSKPRLVALCLWPFAMEVEVQFRKGDEALRVIENYGPEVSGAVPIHTSLAYFVKRGAVSFHGEQDRRNEPLLFMASESYVTLKRKFAAGRGFFCLPGEHGEPRKIARPGPPRLIRDEWDTGIGRIVQECEDSGIPLLIRLTPIPASIADARDFSPLADWSARLQSSHHTVTVRALPLLAYDAQLVYDLVHLNARGVAKFAPVIAADVQSVLLGK